MANITLRKNTPLGLTNEQVDNNFINLNNGIYQVAGSNLYPDFDFKDPSFYTADSGTVWSFNPNSISVNGGYINTLVISSANKSVYTGWFKVEPNTEYIFSSTQNTSGAGGIAEVYVEFATVTDYITDSFTPTTKTLIASNSTLIQNNIDFSLKTGVNDRRARFVLENFGSTAGCIFGELKCLDTQKSYTYKNNLFPNNTFENNSLSGWEYTGVGGVVPKSHLSSVNPLFNEVPNWVTLGVGESLVSHCPVSDLYAKGVYGLKEQKFCINFYCGVDNGNAGGTLEVFLNHLSLSGTFTKIRIHFLPVKAGSSVSSYTAYFVLPSTGMFNISFETNGTSKNLFIGAPHLRMIATASEISSGQISFSHLDSNACGEPANSNMLRRNGIANIGSQSKISRIDHVHPRDEFGGMKNHIINGNFMFWQRGNSQTTTGYGSADRWKLVSNGTGFTHTMVKDVVNATSTQNNFSKHCAKISIAGMSTGADKIIKLVQPMEDVRKFYGKNVVLSFWGKASVSKQIYATLNSPHSDFSFSTVSSYPQLTTAWQKFEYIFKPTRISTTTIDEKAKVQEDLGLPTYLNLELVLSTGKSTDPQYLFNGDIYITGVQIEFGDASTDFEDRGVYVEEQLCKRYFEFIEEPISGHGTGNNSSARPNYRFTVAKRAVPSITLRSDLILTSPTIYTSASGTGSITNIIPVDITKNGINEMSISCDVNIATGSFNTTKIPLNVDAEI